MDKAGRARMQARIVLVVYRAETRRLARIEISPSDRLEWVSDLQRRSIELIDEALVKLDGGPGTHIDAKRTLAAARAEIADPSAV